VTISTEEMLRFATRIGARSMGKHLTEQFGRRNAVEGELVVRVRAEQVFAMRDFAD